jgi:hypothetical protein
MVDQVRSLEAKKQMGQRHSYPETVADAYKTHIGSRAFPMWYPLYMRERLSNRGLLDNEFTREEYIAVLCRMFPERNWADELKGMNLEQVRLFVRFVVFDPNAPTVCRETPSVSSREAFQQFRQILDNTFRREASYAKEQFDKVRYKDVSAGQKRPREEVIEILSSDDDGPVTERVLRKEDKMECEICNEDMCREGTYPAALPCGHVFCRACISRLAIKTCPECRRPFTDEQVRRLYICKET